MNGANDQGAIVEDEELPGLAGERTDLAWTRIGLSVLAAVGAILKRVVHGFDLKSASAIALALVVGSVGALSATLVFSETSAEVARPGQSSVSPRRLRRVAYGTAAFAVAATALALFPNAP
jgi:uncharacterized membrane protein YidH (DUF202 family)